MRFGKLAALAFVAAVGMVLLTDLTDGWSWLGGLVIPVSLVIWIDFRRGRHFRVIARDVATLIGLLLLGLMVALPLVILVAWMV